MVDRAHNKANNEVFKLVKVVDLDAESDGGKRVSVRIHSASNEDFLIYVHKKMNYMLENQYVLTMKKWSSVASGNKNLLQKCYFNLWLEPEELAAIFDGGDS